MTMTSHFVPIVHYPPSQLFLTCTFTLLSASVGPFSNVRVFLSTLAFDSKDLEEVFYLKYPIPNRGILEP